MEAAVRRPNNNFFIMDYYFGEGMNNKYNKKHDELKTKC